MRITMLVAMLALLLAPAMPASAQSTDKVLTPRTFIEVAKRVLPAVVSIDVETPPNRQLLEENGAESLDELLRNWMQDPQEHMNPEFWRRFNEGDFGFNGAGSGVVFGVENGWAYLLTNSHVVSAGPTAQFTIHLDSSIGDGFEKVSGEQVELVGSDSLTDLAVLRFRAPDGVRFPQLRFADSNSVEIGEWVLALGNPLELNNSVSQGIVSAKNRRIGKTGIEDLLQTTAVINPGNSGGPLVNLEGDIVGINNAIATSTGRWAGVGFAIPSNQAKRVSEMLKDKGRVSRGYLGIQMEPLSDSLARAFDLDRDAGILVADVRPDSPADKAGLQLGDILTSVDGRRIRDYQDVHSKIGNSMPGDKVELDVIRLRGDEREDMEVKVTLAERPTEQELDSQLGPDLRRPDRGTTSLQRRMGLELEPHDEEGLKGLEVTSVTPDSVAARAGLRVGDVIVMVNGLETTTTRELREALGNVREGKDHVVLYNREGQNQFVTMDQVED